MKLTRRQASLVLLLQAPQLAWGASIVAVRVWPAADYTRVTIESDAPLNARHSVVHNPDRIVIDIDGLELSAQLRELVGKVQSDDPYIAGVRVGQNSPRVVRLVIDLKQAAAPQVFNLTPVAAYQHRLVFDLYPAEAALPLLPSTLPMNSPKASRIAVLASFSARSFSRAISSSGSRASAGYRSNTRRCW
jgi:N-acetylmuramoyl-L-alanine amidase